MNEEETGLELEKKESRQKWVRGRHIERERERESERKIYITQEL